MKKEERPARNVKIIIRWYTSSAYVSFVKVDEGFSSDVEGRFYNSWLTSTFTCTYTRRAWFFCEYAGRILQGTRPRIPGGFIGFYSLFGTDAYCWARFAPRMNQTRVENETWRRGEGAMVVSGRAEIDLLGLNKGLNFYKNFSRNCGRNVLEQRAAFESSRFNKRYIRIVW